MLNIFSSHAIDTVTTEDGTTTIQGGPAFFIESILEKNHIQFTNFLKRVGSVSIIIKDGGESGKVTAAETLQEYPVLEKDEHILISTLLNEVDLSLFAHHTNVYIDIQGYVRNPDGSLGSKKKYQVPENFKPAILKSTEEELTFLDDTFINGQKERMLIVTRGASGATIYSKNRVFTRDVNKKIFPKNTIGAGDTYFSSFIVAYLKENTIESCADFAQTSTEIFLKQK